MSKIHIAAVENITKHSFFRKKQKNKKKLFRALQLIGHFYANFQNSKPAFAMFVAEI